MERARGASFPTNMLVREISLSVGYEDDHVFTRRFKKYTGKTPDSTGGAYDIVLRKILQES